VKQEPDASFNGSARLAELINQNQDALIAGTYVVPNDFDDLPFLAGRAAVPLTLSWQAPGVSPEARAAFARGTCSGCHLSETGGVTGTDFLHVRNRARGVAATLSPFLADALATVRSADFMSLLQPAPAPSEPAEPSDAPGPRPAPMVQGPGLDTGNELTPPPR
jgi:hypothetical protein